MSTAEALLRDLSLLLELTLVPNEQVSLELFAEQFIDRLLARTYAYNALLFVHGSLAGESRAPDETPRDSLLGVPTPIEARNFVALPRKRAQYLVGSRPIDPETSGLAALVQDGGTRIVPGAESVLARIAFSGVERPNSVLQMTIGTVGVLEIYGGAADLLDEHLARVLSTLSEWLAGQAKSFGLQAGDRHRLDQMLASERWIARLFDELPGVIWRADVHGRITYISAQAGPLLGLESAATWADLRRGIHPADATRVEQSIAAAIAARESGLSLHFRFRRGTGDVISIDERILFGFLPDGGLINKAGFIDLSRQQMDELAPRSSLSRPTFMDRLSHELRSPLFPVIALSDLLLQLDPRTVSREDWRRHLTMINTSGKALLELVTDLLELSRVEVQRSRQDAGPVDLARVARDLATRFSGPAAPVAFSVDPPRESDTIYTDRSALDRVLNAVTASVRNLAGERGAEVVLHADELEVSVRAVAHGVRLAETLVEEWFEPFPSLPRDTREGSVGDGLSMTLVRELADALGGHSAAWSSSRGLELKVTLPARRAAGPGVGPLAGRLILLVLRELRSSLPLTLEVLALGGEVRLARDLDSAEQVLRDVPVHAVIASRALLGRGRLAAAADHAASGVRPRCLVLDALLPHAPGGFDGVLRPDADRETLRRSLYSDTTPQR